MLPLYLAGAALLGLGAYAVTRKPKIPPAVAQAAIQSPAPASAKTAPAPAPAASTVITPNSPEVQAAVAAATGVSPEQAAFDAAKAQAAAASQQVFQQQFPGTGINPGIQSATQFNPAPGASLPEAQAVASAAQTASDALSSGGVFASPAQQLQSMTDLLNQVTGSGDGS